MAVLEAGYKEVYRPHVTAAESFEPASWLANVVAIGVEVLVADLNLGIESVKYYF